MASKFDVTIGTLSTVIGLIFSAVPYFRPAYHLIFPTAEEGLAGEWICVGECAPTYSAKIKVLDGGELELSDEHRPANISSGRYYPSDNKVINGTLTGNLINDGNIIDWGNHPAWVRNKFRSSQAVLFGVVAGLLFGFALSRFWKSVGGARPPQEGH
ncbi:hypothetical protein [Cupriavidus sp. CP313]